MYQSFFLVLLLLSFSAAGFSQKENSALKTAELYSAYLNAQNPPELNEAKVSRNCFDFVKESEVKCGENRWDLVYGNLRTGDDWNWFEVSSSKNVRSKIVNLGKLDWTDSLTIPVIEPYRKLKEGEGRVMTVDTSGKNGNSGNSKAADASEKNEAKTSGGFTKAVLGNVYAARIVDGSEDFYVLFRVDALEGDKCVISWKRADAPKEK